MKGKKHPTKQVAAKALQGYKQTVQRGRELQQEVSMVVEESAQTGAELLKETSDVAHSTGIKESGEMLGNLALTSLSATSPNFSNLVYLQVQSVNLWTTLLQESIRFSLGLAGMGAKKA